MSQFGAHYFLRATVEVRLAKQLSPPYLHHPTSLLRSSQGPRRVASSLPADVLASVHLQRVDGESELGNIHAQPSPKLELGAAPAEPPRRLPARWNQRERNKRKLTSSFIFWQSEYSDHSTKLGKSAGRARLWIMRSKGSGICREDVRSPTSVNRYFKLLASWRCRHLVVASSRSLTRLCHLARSQGTAFDSFFGGTYSAQKSMAFLQRNMKK